MYIAIAAIVKQIFVVCKIAMFGMFEYQYSVWFKYVFL